ncbi:MAG: D-arabinono-1,4-lactone oxidase [Actinomycetota bacterium]
MARLAPRFTNWAGNQTCLPMERRAPMSTDEVADIVATAHSRGGRVKVVGAGHSFTDAACTNGVLLSLDAIDEVTDHDPETREVTVGAGIRLHDLNERLHDLGLALPNLGDIDTQSLAGATATATHGTGRALGNLSTNIVGFELVTGTGEVLWCDASSNAEVWSVGRVGIGALGVVTKIRLSGVPSFNLHADERGAGLDKLLDDWDGFVSSADHTEFFWLPGSGACLTKRNRRTDEPERPPSRVRHLIEKEFGENVALDLAMRAVRRFPSQRERIRSAFAAVGTSSRDVVDRSYRVFASPRRVRFREMEYSIPVAAVPEALRRVRSLVDAMAEPPLFPVEVRVSAADDIALSTAEGRDSGWIAVHQYVGIPYGDYFRGVEAIMDDYDGRPHWGKLHFQTHETLRPRYPQWDRFAEARAKVDPSGTFRNDYLDRVLGPID